MAPVKQCSNPVITIQTNYRCHKAPILFGALQYYCDVNKNFVFIFWFIL